jgi:hypothetical protein
MRRGKIFFEKKKAKFVLLNLKMSPARFLTKDETRPKLLENVEISSFNFQLSDIDRVLNHRPTEIL